MRALSLDLYHGIRRTNMAGIILLALGLAATTISGLHYLDTSDGIASREAQIAGLDQAARHKPVKTRQEEQQAQQLGVEIKHAHQVEQELSLPWDLLFRAVETVGNKDVALLAIEPDAKKRLLRITGEARNLSAMLAYIRLLEQQPVLTDVYLQNHHFQQQDAEKPVRFSLGTSWRAAP